MERRLAEILIAGGAGALLVTRFVSGPLGWFGGALIGELLLSAWKRRELPHAHPAERRAATPSAPRPSLSGVAAVPGIERLSPDELGALADAADWIGIDVDWLAAVISFETGGTFDPAQPNRAGSGAVGLIQFMPSTAKSLGTSTDALARMTFTVQLAYVKKFFAPHRGQLHSLEDTYLAVFMPAALGKAPSDVVASQDGHAGLMASTSQNALAYKQNAGFDRDKKGYFTRRDITDTITGHLGTAVARGRRVRIPEAVA
jgi:hypothetical protein